MAINKIVGSVDEAVADVHDGAVILVGGFGNIWNAPSYLLTAISKLPVKDLTVVSNSGGFGIEVWGGVFGVHEHDVEVLHRTKQCTRHIVSAPTNPLVVNTLETRYRAGELELDLVYAGTSRTFNATMAGAAKVTIAEVDEIVELGELDAEAIITPGLYVNRVVLRQ
jgi:acyl CoA:acetate/3-ketoacid CoA transferase alpha subunit